jgi:hypothetical protein
MIVYLRVRLKRQTDALPARVRWRVIEAVNGPTAKHVAGPLFGTGTSSWSPRARCKSTAGSFCSAPFQHAIE